MKKFLSILMCLMLVISTLTFVSISASAYTSGYYTYTVSNGEATITDVDTSISGNITIPSTLGGYPVTIIGYYAFKYCTALTSITIPNSVTSIGSSAFWECTSLTSITIGNSVTSICDWAFYNCARLTSITIPDSVISIGSSAYKNCTSLTSIAIGNSAISIGQKAFDNTGYYNNQDNWKDNVLYIGNNLINAKSSISGSYTIKNGTKVIADDAFYHCTSLTSITIPDSVTSIGNSAFYHCTSLTSITIGNSVTSIGDFAFYGCDATFYCYCNSYVINYLENNNFNISIIAHDYSILKYDTTGHWYKCSNCSSTTAKEAHSGGTATCTSKAVCSVCNQSYGSTPSGHNYTEKTIKSPTCEDEGTLRYTCSRCNDTYDKETSALGHDFVITNTVKPTVLSNGYDVLECKRDGCDFVDYFYYDKLPIEYNKTYYENGTHEYRVDLNKSGFLTFEFIGESKIWNINIYDEDYKKVDALKPVYKEFFKKSYLQASVGSSVPNENQITALFSGTYYVVIERVEDNTNANYSGDYQFSVDYHSSNETLTESKYNFYYDAPTSREINLNKKYNGFLGSKYAAYNYSGDEITVSDTRDAYKFEIPKGSGWSQLSVTLSAKSFPPLSSNCTISIYNTDFDLCEDFTPLTVSADEEKMKSLICTRVFITLLFLHRLLLNILSVLFISQRDLLYAQHIKEN